MPPPLRGPRGGGVRSGAGVKPPGGGARMIIPIIITGPRPMPPDPRSRLPLKPVEFVLLLALSEGECHGYGLVHEIEERTDGAIRLEPGNLYRVIRRLMDGGLVAESARRRAPDLDHERRRYYRITALGSRVASAEARRLRALLATPTARNLAEERA